MGGAPPLCPVRWYMRCCVFTHPPMSTRMHRTSLCVNTHTILCTHIAKCRTHVQDFSASSSSQPGMYAGEPVSDLDKKFGYQLSNFARGRRQDWLRRRLAAPTQSLFAHASDPNPEEGTYALSPFTKQTYPRQMGTNQVFLGHVNRAPMQQLYQESFEQAEKAQAMYDKPRNSMVHVDSAGHVDVENFG